MPPGHLRDLHLAHGHGDLPLGGVGFDGARGLLVLRHLRCVPDANHHALLVRHEGRHVDIHADVAPRAGTTAAAGRTGVTDERRGPFFAIGGAPDAAAALLHGL